VPKILNVLLRTNYQAAISTISFAIDLNLSALPNIPGVKKAPNHLLLQVLDFSIN